MERAEVVTDWIGTGAQEDSNRPSLGDAFTLSKWEDITGQPAANIRPDPNAYVVYTEAETAVMDAIAADPNHVILEGTREVIPEDEFDIPDTASTIDEIPTPQEFLRFRRELAKMRDGIGTRIWSERQISQAIGAEATGNTWGEINTRIIQYLRNAPKGECSGL